MIVLDASVVVDLLLRVPGSAEIEDRVFGGDELNAPHLLDVEVAHVLRRRTLRGELTASRGKANLELLAEFPIRRYSHEPLLERMWSLRDNLTAYDAAYVSLAEVLGATLLTRDEALAQASGHTAEIEIV